MTTPEHRLLAIRIVKLEQLLKEACDNLHECLTFSNLGLSGAELARQRDFLAKARAALEPTCMVCGGAPCVCERGAES